MTEQKTGKPLKPFISLPDRPPLITSAVCANSFRREGRAPTREIQCGRGARARRPGRRRRHGLVLEGILREERIPASGQRLVVRALYDVTPGESLSSGAPQGARGETRTRVVAVTDGEAVFVTLEDLTLGKQAQRLIEDLIGSCNTPLKRMTTGTMKTREHSSTCSRASPPTRAALWRSREPA